MAAGGAAVTLPAFSSGTAAENVKSIFEWRVYHVSRNANARKSLEQYFQIALIPFLKKKNAGFAAFTEYSLNEPVILYTLIAYPDGSAYLNIQADMLTDPEYLKSSEEYNNIPASGAIFTRYETFLLEGFEKFPVFTRPAEKKGLFELRLYESASEDAGRRKIAMFNNEEIPLFLKVGLMPVFFSKIIAGQHMPGLLYMIGFKDMAERDAAWGRFSDSDEWKVMREKPEYADSVSNIHRVFLIPATYSEI